MPNLAPSPEALNALNLGISFLVSTWKRFRAKKLPSELLEEYSILGGLRGVGLEYENEFGDWILVFYVERESLLDAALLQALVFLAAPSPIKLRIRVTGIPYPLGLSSGVSIGPGYWDNSEGFQSGTLGALVKLPDDRVCYLSCNHVLTVNGEVFRSARPDDFTVFQPSKLYAGPSTPIATSLQLAKCHLSDSEFNLGDWALAELKPEVPRSPWWPTLFPPGLTLTADLPANPSTAMNKKVFKVGAATNLTEGIVSCVGKTFDLVYPAIQGQRFDFKNQIRIKSSNPEKPFALPGDSGSLVVTEDGFALGLVYAKDNSETLVCPLLPLFKALKLKFVI